MSWIPNTVLFTRCVCVCVRCGHKHPAEFRGAVRAGGGCGRRSHPVCQGQGRHRRLPPHQPQHDGPWPGTVPIFINTSVVDP